jgi:cellulose synthase/poly-beta-1,6-N-acetylglucosamine synthase-like glycosyltransferase
MSSQPSSLHRSPAAQPAPSHAVADPWESWQRASVRDSLVRDSLVRDSQVRDSLVRDSQVRDSQVRPVPQAQPSAHNPAQGVVAIDATTARETIYENIRWEPAKPVLSVLVPFFRDDPRPLLHALDREHVNAEIIVVDDGSADEALTRRVVSLVLAMRLPAKVVHLDRNEGRSRGRNRLARHARSSSFLFLDSDMLPDGPSFLGTYVHLVANHNPAVVFGGYSTRQAPDSPEYNLHRHMAQKSDCAPAAIRRLFPEKHVFTSNLLVRRDVFESEAFDEGFRGWGWEDVEWGHARWSPLSADPH